MIRTILGGIAAVTLCATAVPALAQDADNYVEDQRTTYAITMIKLADGAEQRWLEMHEKYVVPARKAAGQSPEVVHFLMLNDDYDLMVVSEMPDGMATFDSHRPASRWAFRQQVNKIAGGADKMPPILEEWDKLEKASKTMYTHTHP
ncbi:hypothetical protein [Qipengyuania oceanensis]|uniref:Uncharacterized protein n=1 Tax=Qipengyuania oceanensis TaxID=1463597 RepID=A0A844YD53_9SPHN|nr:hypothetical protein [Qipengyuania oceanensis]MXO61513.1 hypothetical protein [Qipengyuania oceanensis]